jgi:hypothetical protein
LAGPIRGACGFVFRVRNVAGLERVAAFAGFRRCVRRANLRLVLRILDMDVGAFRARFDWLRSPFLRARVGALVRSIAVRGLLS